MSESAQPGPSTFVVIFNPRAARARAIGRRGIERVLRDCGLEFELVETATDEQAREVARQAADAGFVVVSAGGDGSAHAVVNGVLGSRNADATAGFLPLGTGNDFARLLGRDDPSLHAAAEALARKQLCWVDVGQVNGDEFFLNGLGVGFDAEVVRRRLRQRWRTRSYLPTVARTILSYRPAAYCLSWPEGEVEGPALMVAAMNGPSEGGGFRLAPGARAASGVVDVCWIDPIGLVQFLRYVGAVRRGSHTELSIFRSWPAKRMKVESDSALQYHVDGEYRELAPGGRLEIVVHHRRLQVIT